MRRATRVSALLFLLCVELAFARADEVLGPYFLRSVSFDSQGRSRVYYLAKAASIEVGLEFPDLEALKAYVAGRRQILLNERVLEKVEIEMVFVEASGFDDGDTDAAGRVAVDLIVHSQDSWNLVALPYAKYDSNSGLLLALRGRDYNFLGTMEPFILNINWLIDENGENEPSATLSCAIPFGLSGFDCSWSFSSGLTLPLDARREFVATTGFQAKLPLASMSLGFSATQSLNYNQQNSSGRYYDDPLYFVSSLVASLSQKLGEGPLGRLDAKESLDFAYCYSPGGLVDNSLKDTPTLTPALSLSFGRADWMGNFRRGIVAEASYKLVGNLKDSSFWTAFTGSVKAYGSLGIAGPSTRLSWLWYQGSSTSGAGASVRGVLDSRISTDAALILNLDCPIKLIDFDATSLIKTPWARYLGFEQQWSPFLDVALVHAPNGSYFDPSYGWYGAGLEVLTFPKATRAFYLRISAGYCVNDVVALGSLSGSSPRDGRGIKEVYIGLGHFY